MATLDLGWKKEGLGKKLSNLFPHKFVLDGVKCGSMEGFLQSLKQESQESRELIAELHGYPAFKTGQLGNDWKVAQLLYWDGISYPRFSAKYHELLIRAYDACYEQNEVFRTALFETGVDTLVHTIQKHDPTDTVLTGWEYIFNMYRLRARAQQDINSCGVLK